MSQCHGYFYCFDLCVITSLTIHLDLERYGCIGRVTLGIKGVLALLLRIHSLKLQSCVVSIKRKTSTFKMRKRGM